MVNIPEKLKQSGIAHSKRPAGLFSFLLVSVLILPLVFLTGCSKDDDTSFQERLSLIDACISSGQLKDALSLTDKAADAAIGKEQSLSVMKRYRKLGQEESLRAYLEKLLKKQPDVMEYNAVYGDLLLKDGNTADAAKYADMFWNTKWSTISTEIMLKQAAEKTLIDGDYSDIFIAAAESTGNDAWLIDAAVSEAGAGNLKKAASITPFRFTSENDALFWALINYDAGNYLECIDICRKYPGNTEMVGLCSDSWLKLGENTSADDFWLSLVNKNDGSVPSYIYANAALYAINTDNLEDAYRILVTMVNRYPEYEEGLALYADYALKTMGSLVTGAVSPLSTLQKNRMESIPVIPVSDAMYRMEQAFSRNRLPDLYVEYLKVKWLSGSYSQLECRQDILLALEKYREGNVDDQYMVDFAVCWLLRNYYEPEAVGIFVNYMAEKYGLSMNDAVQNAWQLEDRDCMLAAWIQLHEGNVQNALALYETYIYDRNMLSDIKSAVNLAAIYNACGRTWDALQLYGSLAGITKDMELASEIYCRMGYIQSDRNDKKNALLSLSYSVKLNPNNNRARLLLKTLQ